jgi:hypothetical protein
MKKLIIGLVLGIISLVGVQASDAVKNIVGMQATCDSTLSGCNPIPINFSLICSGATCPFRSSPALGGTQMYAAVSTGTGACITSTDNGTTWNACGSQPFNGTSANELYAAASDGSVVAVARQTGPTACVTARSTNGGVTWSTQTTFALLDCNPGNLEDRKSVV